MNAATPQTHPYQHLANQVAAKIDSGELRPGDRLPSLRALAEEYDTTTATVQRAMGVLADGGWIKRVPNVGLFVRDHSQAEEPASLGEIKTLLDQALHALGELAQRVDRLEAAGGPPDGQQRP